MLTLDIKKKFQFCVLLLSAKNRSFSLILLCLGARHYLSLGRREGTEGITRFQGYGRGISCRQQNAKVGLNISHLDSRQKASTAATLLN